MVSWTIDSKIFITDPFFSFVGFSQFEGISDSSSALIKDAGQNATLNCEGVTSSSFVNNLSWICRGCNSSSPGYESTIVEFKARLAMAQEAGDAKESQGAPSNENLTSVHYSHHRAELSRDFSLILNPLTSEDSGEYRCIVNGRIRPNSLHRLYVKGKSIRRLFWSFRAWSCFVFERVFHIL